MVMDIDVKLLRSFVVIYERGSLSRAADQLACTQAAMSMRLKWLETELGESLFRRQHHKLEPTFKGVEFYARALTVLAAYDEMISGTRNTSHRSKIRLGVPDDYALSILPKALRRIAPLFARVEIEIICDLSAKLAAAVSRQELDLALVTLASRPTNSLGTVEVSLNWVFDPCYIPNAGQPIGLAAYPEGCVFRRSMIQSLDEAGMPWAVLAQSQNRAGIVAALSGQIGVSAIVAGTAPRDLVEVSENSWLPTLPRIPISIISTHAALSPEGQQFAAAMKAELESFQSDIHFPVS
jgi:DNA-binding transcriptional LysR family regulator